MICYYGLLVCVVILIEVPLVMDDSNFMSELELIYDHECSQSFEFPIYLLCVFRDEYLLLDYFISYYKSLGVTHFLLVDNLSSDEGVAYLKKKKDINIKLFHASGSYSDAQFGTKWINSLLDEYCIGQYCFTVDIDELFYFNKNKYKDLHSLINEMEILDKNVVPVTLLDMYPKKTNNNYQRGMSFLSHSSFFDDWCLELYEYFFLYGKYVNKAGGVRKRVLNTRVCIHKFPFFKYDFQPLKLVAGYHFFQLDSKIVLESANICLFDPEVLLHFKFIKPDLKSFFNRRVKLNQDWDDSSEYKSYLYELSKEKGIVFYSKKYSRRFESFKDLRLFFEPILVSNSILIEPQQTKENELLLYQEVGVFLYLLVFRVWLSKKQYQKLREKPFLFFSDSNSRITRAVGAILKIL